MNKRSSLLAGTLLAAALGSQLAGCFWATTKHEGKSMRADIDRIDEVVTRQEESLGESVKKLKSTLEEASTLLARNSADLGAQFDELENENARLTGLVMEAKRYTDEVFTQVQRFEKRIEDLEAKIGEIEGKANAPVIAQTPDELYDEGLAAYNAKDYNKARETFRKLVIKFPGHARADDAQFKRGEAYFVQKDYKSAVTEYQTVFDKFASSGLADDALFRAGESAENLKWCTDARAYFGLLRQKYPKSDLVARAKKKDAELKKNAKNKKLCQS